MDPRTRKNRTGRLWRRLRWPLLLAVICGGAGLLLSLGLTGAGVG
jgi:hypothetical protein